MSCPPSSPHCENQPPSPPGDGCDEIEWWLSPEAKEDRAERGKSYSKRVGAKPTLPDPCKAVLEDKAAGAPRKKNTQQKNTQQKKNAP